MSRYSDECIYCGKFVSNMSIYGNKYIMAKQKGKYGKTLYAHLDCYLSQTIGVKEKENNKI